MNPISDEEAAEIKWRALYGNKTQKEIGEMYGVTQASVSKIKSGARRPRVNPKRPDFDSDFFSFDDPGP